MKRTGQGTDVPRVTRDQPFGIIDVAVTRDESLPWQVKAVYVHFAGFAGKERDAFPSLARIARETGMSKPSVIAAVKCGEKAGLFLVREEYVRDGQRSAVRGDGEQTSNRYQLRDFGTGYIVGSGPGRRLPYPDERGKAASPRAVKPLDPGSQAAVPEQDHPSSTTRSSTHTSPDEDTVVIPPRPKIFRPKRLDQMSTSRASEQCVAYVVRAFNRVGWDLTKEARTSIGRYVKRQLDEKGMSHDEMWKALLVQVDTLGKPDTQYVGWAVPMGHAA